MSSAPGQPSLPGSLKPANTRGPGKGSDKRWAWPANKQLRPEVALTLSDAAPGDWQELPDWLAGDDDRRQAVEADERRQQWDALDFARRWRSLPEPVECETCHEPFRPGERWLETHGDRCADCTGDALFVVP